MHGTESVGGGPHTHEQSGGILTATYSTVNDWGRGFQGAIRVENDGSTRESAWTVTCEADFEITRI